MSSVDALRLRADGVAVPTTNDGEATLRMDLLALSIIEEDLGSIGDAWAEFLAAHGDSGRRGRLVTLLGTFLRAGLAEPGAIPTAVEALGRIECHPDVLADLVVEAMAQAFPPTEEAPAPGEARADGSTGPPGTTSPPSAGTAPTTSGGA